MASISVTWAQWEVAVPGAAFCKETGEPNCRQLQRTAPARKESVLVGSTSGTCPVLSSSQLWSANQSLSHTLHILRILWSGFSVS